MLEAEMNEHLGYERYETSENQILKWSQTKEDKILLGETEISVPQDRDSSFEPQVVRKREKDISEIENKIISMYGLGMTTRQISRTDWRNLWI